MATAAKLPRYPHIESAQAFRGGKACIRGTRIAVVDIVIAHQEGRTPGETETARAAYLSRRSKR